MAEAVSLLSPVIMTTCTPAPRTCSTEARASGRISSRMPTSPTRISRLNSPCSVTAVSEIASASTRMACLVISCHLARSRWVLPRGRNAPVSSTYRLQASSSFSGAPLTRVSRLPGSSRAENFRALSKGTCRPLASSLPGASGRT